jgi:hypothetical protein
MDGSASTDHADKSIGALMIEYVRLDAKVCFGPIGDIPTLLDRVFGAGASIPIK